VVHLELVSHLSELGMLRAFQRFCSRRGIPDVVWSDHGTNFVALAKTLSSVHKSSLKWHFVVERGPWWGGLWERLVRSVKSLLKRTLGRSLLNWDQLETVVTTIEGVLNKRPISYMWDSQHQNDCHLPVVPQDFLLFRSPATQETEPFDQDTLSGILEEKAKFTRELERKWQEEYLLSVLGSFGRKYGKGVIRNPIVGELVLMQLEGKQRQLWPLARVMQLHPGADGVVRAATVQLGQGHGTFTRPVKKLFPLEVEVNIHQREGGDSDDETCQDALC
jgi:hypothetical protein